VSDITEPDALAIRVLETAARLGFQFYRTGYYSYSEGESWRRSLEQAKRKFDALAEVNARLGLHGAYQNHAGRHVGAYMPDVAFLVDGLDQRWAGCQFDIRHAVVEGGLAWPHGLRIVKDHVRTMPIKDFVWGMRDGRRAVVNVPLGEGVVEFGAFFREVRRHGLTPLVSLHLEYELGGADQGRRELTIPREEVYRAMARDLAKFRELWRASTPDPV
jgi:L-ribulose-5-phosphate 3-epimerase